MDISIRSIDRLRGFAIADHERRGAAGSTPRRSSPKRIILWLLVTALLGVAGAAGYSYRRVNDVPPPETPVRTSEPERNVLLDLSGFIVPRSKIVVSPQVNGVLARVCIAEEGQKVKTGDLLFEVDDVRYRAEYEQAEAALAIAGSQLEELENGRQPEEKAHARALYEQAKVQEKLAVIEFERARKLFPNAIGRADYDRNLTNYHDAKAAVKVQQSNVDLVEAETRHEKINAAKAEVKRAQAVHDRAKYYLEKTKIRAPSDEEGKPRIFTVLQKNVNPGESIQADFVYTSLCTLADLSEMEAEVEVQERDLPLLHKGMACEVLADAYPNRRYRGVLSRMQPLVNRQRGVVQVRIALLAPDEYLLPDMNARILFLKDAVSSSEN